MPNDRAQASEVEAIKAVADRIAQRTGMRFVIDDRKKDEFERLSAAISANVLSQFASEAEDNPLIGRRA